MIHILEDGRQKYVTHRGKIVKWQYFEIDVFARNLHRYGPSAYTSDLSAYGVTVEGLRARFPYAQIVRVIDYRSEDHDLPLCKDIIR